MRTRNFYDVAQASQQLRGSIIRVGDKPVHVIDAFSGDKVGEYVIQYAPCKTPNDRDYKLIPVDHPSIDMNPVPLGMISFIERGIWSVYYTARLPVRKWKIGLSRENVTVKFVRGFDSGNGFEKVYHSALIHDLIMGIYPKLKSIRSSFNKNAGARAFSRRFALDNDEQLFYKTIQEPVGIMRKGIEFELQEDYAFLKEVLEEDLHESN